MKLYLSIRDDDGNIIMESLVLESDHVQFDNTIFTEQALKSVIFHANEHAEMLSVKHGLDEK